LQSEHERYLVEKHFKRPVILYDYPATIKAFYMRLNEDQKTVRAMDILFPGIGEMVGGSQREERLQILQKRMEEMQIDQEELGWYLDLRRFGSVVHSGFGLGFERLVMFTTGMNNIRDVIPYPRTPQNASF
jgi:asparaginyl-tRNA synthetase